MRPSTISVFALAVLVFGSSGCDRVKRVRECRGVVRLVNARADEVAALGKKDEPDAYRAAAALYTTLAKEVRAVALSAPAAQAVKEEYAATLDSISPAVAMYATTLESGEQHRIDEARRSLERLRRMEQAVAKRFEHQCDGI